MAKKRPFFILLLLSFSLFSAEDISHLLAEAVNENDQIQKEEPWFCVKKIQSQNNESETITTEELGAGWQELSSDFRRKQKIDLTRLIRTTFYTMLERDTKKEAWIVRCAKK